MSLTVGQHPKHPQGTAIWHLTCSRASLDPAGEHHDPAWRVSFQSCPALLVIYSHCVSRVQWKSALVPRGQGEELIIPLCWNQLSWSVTQWAAGALLGTLGTWRSQTDCCQPPCGIPGADLWLRAVVMPSGGMSLFSTISLRELANCHLVHYKTNLIWHYWFPEA